MLCNLTPACASYVPQGNVDVRSRNVCVPMPGTATSDNEPPCGRTHNNLVRVMVAQLVVRLQSALGLHSLNASWTVSSTAAASSYYMYYHMLCPCMRLYMALFVSRQDFNLCCASGSSYTRCAQSDTGSPRSLEMYVEFPLVEPRMRRGGGSCV